MNETELKNLNQIVKEKIQGLPTREQALAAMNLAFEASGFAAPTRTVTLSFIFEDDKNMNGRIQASMSITPPIVDGEFTIAWPLIKALARFKAALENPASIDEEGAVAAPPPLVH